MQAADTSSLYWAHPIANPEKGCVLIAHPLMFTTQQQYFAQVCVIIKSGVCCKSLTEAPCLRCHPSPFTMP